MIPNNPNFPVVDFWIQDYNLGSIPPHHLLSFTYDRSTLDEANVFSLSVFDESALALEMLIAEGAEECAFQYGYSGGAMSKKYYGMITDYNLQFTGRGVTLEIEGISTGVASYGKPKTITYSNKNIDDIVKEIAKDEGWKVGKIEPTQFVFSEEKNSDGTYKLKSFTRNNLSAVQFIKQELSPLAVSSTNNEGGYQLWFDDSTDPVTVNFAPASMKKITDDDVSFYELRYGVGNQSPVLSFTPNFAGALAASQGAGTVDMTTIDKLANEMFKITYNKDSNPNKLVSGSKTSVNPNKWMALLNNSSYGKDEASKLAATMWYKMANTSYGAVLELVGNPKLEPMSMCSVYVVNKEGIPHHTTGIYLTTQITDTIDGGSFTSTLQLIRNGLSVGVDDNGGLDITLNTDYVAISGGANQSSSSDQTLPDGTPISGSLGSTEQLRSVIDKYIGLPYVWGGTGPNGYDCSGFTQAVLKEFGISQPRTTSELNNGSWGQVIPWDKSLIQPGDLITYNKNGKGHVVMIVDNLTVAHAPSTGKTITYAGLQYYWDEYQKPSKGGKIIRPTK